MLILYIITTHVINADVMTTQDFAKSAAQSAQEAQQDTGRACKRVINNHETLEDLQVASQAAQAAQIAAQTAAQLSQIASNDSEIRMQVQVAADAFAKAAQEAAKAANVCEKCLERSGPERD